MLCCLICLVLISGRGPLGSLVNTLEKLDCSVSAFSLSEHVCYNFAVFGSFISSVTPSSTCIWILYISRLT